MHVYVDSCIFIYLLDENSTWGKQAKKTIITLVQKNATFATSVLAQYETLAGFNSLPMGYQRFRRLLDSFSCAICAVDDDSVDNALRIKQQSMQEGVSLKPMDALHLGIAKANLCTAFFTNDVRLERSIKMSMQLIRLEATL